MIESFTRNGADDFRQRYQRTYGYLLGKDNKKTLCYISKVDDRVQFDTITGKNFFVYWDAGVEFEFLPITRGWFYTRDGWVLLQRVPAKQYNRGISKFNTACSMWCNYHKDMKAHEITLELLHDIFVAPLHPPEGHTFKHIFLVVSGKVFFYEKQIGTVEGSVITLTSPLLKQELSDFVRRDNQNYTVTHAN